MTQDNATRKISVAYSFDTLSLIFIAIIALTLVASSTNLAFCLRGPRGLAFLNSQECYHFLVCDRHHNRFLYGLNMFECIFCCFSWFHDSHVTAGMQQSTILRIPIHIMNEMKNKRRSSSVFALTTPKTEKRN